MDSFALGRPYDFALDRLTAAGGDVAALAVPLQTLLIVESVQSMIDAGGLEYLYEADFPNNPPYSAFADAYRRIGADAAAGCIEASSLLFPFAEPHLFQELRLLWLERWRAAPGDEFGRLDAQVRADASVWDKLARYVQQHGDAFTAP